MARQNLIGRRWRHVAMTLALMCGMAVAAAAAAVATTRATVVPAAVEGQTAPRRQPDMIGGPAGLAFTSRCPDGQFVVGIAGRAGEVMTRVAPLCVGFDLQNRWVGEPTEGDAEGGQGGGPFRAVCPRDMTVTGFTGIGSEFVINLRLICGLPHRTTEPAVVLPPVGAHPELGSTTSVSCPGQALSGSIRGAASQVINRFGLGCDNTYVAGTPQPSPPPTAGDFSTRSVPPRIYVRKGPPKSQTSIFAVTEDSSELLVSRYTGLQTPSRTWPQRDFAFGSGWGFRHLFSAGDGVLIAITAAGKVLYYKCQCTDGTPSWIVDTPRTIAEGWPDYMRVFSGGHGIIYTLDWKGNLYYNVFLGMEDGAPRWGPTRKRIANQWNDIATAFASGDDGTIFAVTNSLELLYFRYDGLSTGSVDWSAYRKRVDVGWRFRHVFSPDAGVILAVDYDGVMRWYKYLGKDGEAAWAPAGGTVIAEGFTNRRFIFSY